MPEDNKPSGDEMFCVSAREDCIRVQQQIDGLLLSEARYQNLFDAVTDALLAVTREGLVRRANSACERVFGRPLTDLLNASLPSLFPGQSSSVTNAYQQALQGDLQILELSFLGLAGQQLTLALQLSPIFDGPEITGVLLIAHDLSGEKARERERAQLYEELQSSHQQLEEKARALEESQQLLRATMATQEKTNSELREFGRMKSDFIGIASHELRTPLTFLLAALEYLGETLPGRVNEDEQSLLDYAMQGSQRLSDIVENMLDIIRLEAEGFHPERELISLYPFLTHIHGSFRSMLEERQLTLVIGSAPQWPELLVDPAMVRRALEDVVGNAIKHTEAGGQICLTGVVRSRAGLVADAEQIQLFWPEFPECLSWDGDFFEVCVTDNGVGIPQQELPHVFERFYTVGSLDEHSSGDKFLGKGAGLGLALVKRIVHGHDGLSWAVSPGSREATGLKNPGSSFHLLFPYQQSVPAVALPPVLDRKYRLLVVDDEPAIRSLIKVLLHKEYELELAADGVEGLSKARSFNPDLILLDLFMPEMDGFEVCQKLKADPLTSAIPVAMFTAMSRQHERDRGHEVGAVDYIAKPFFPRELIQRIEHLLSEHCSVKKSSSGD